MKNIFTISKTLLLAILLLNVQALSAQADDLVITCPSGICGSDDDFGATDGRYSDSGMTENGQVIYEGPVGNVSYHIKCVGEVLAPGFTVYRWEVHSLAGDLVYFNGEIVLNSTFPFSDIKTAGKENDWTSENSDYDPAIEMGAVLPVDLTYFKAIKDAKTVMLHWQTATEINNEGFEVQHSNDNRHWETLDFVVGEGTSYEKKDYDFVDEKPSNGMNYYRLKQIDFDGRFEYSEVVSQKMQTGQFEIFPNPVNGQTISLNFSAVDYADTQVKIYDNLGRLVQQNVLVYGENQMSIADLPIGVYIVRVQIGNEFLQERLVKK